MQGISERERWYLKLLPKPRLCWRVCENISYFLMSLSDTDLILTYFQTFYARYSHKCRLPPGELHSLLEVRLGDLWHQVLLVIHVHGGGALTGAKTVKYQLQLFEVQGTDIVLLGSLEGLSNTSVFSQNINLNTHWLYQTKEVTATNLHRLPLWPWRPT